MTCEEVLAKYSEYADGRLDAAPAAAVRGHLRACDRCARYDRVLSEGRELLAELPEIEPSYDFEPRLRHRIYHVQDELRAERSADAGAVAALGVAGFLVAAVWSTVMVTTQTGALATGERGAEPAEAVAAEATPQTVETRQQPAMDGASGGFEPLADPAVWVDARQAWWHEHRGTGDRAASQPDPLRQGGVSAPSVWAVDGGSSWPAWSGRRFPAMRRLDGSGTASYSPLVVTAPFQAGSSRLRQATNRRAAPD